MANKTVSIVRICKTERGWRRYPVVFGKNGRIRPGWVIVGGEEKYFENGRYELRLYRSRKLVYQPAGNTPAEVLAARDRKERKLVAKESAEAA